MKESKKFEITVNETSVLLQISEEKSGALHVESLPPKVAIAMGNQLIIKGREVLHEQMENKGNK